MKTGIRAGRSYKEQYSGYSAKGTYGKNRERKLVRHMLRHPEDKVAEKALSSQSYLTYRRQKPRHRGVNTGIALVDKRTGKVTERVKVEERWLKIQPRHIKTVAEQLLELGLISALPKRYSNASKHKGKRARHTNAPVPAKG